jgi:hypothetical protein
MARKILITKGLEVKILKIKQLILCLALHGIADHLRIGLAKSRLDVTGRKLKVRNANRW